MNNLDHSRTGMISVSNLHKSFPMGEQTLAVLKGIDLSIARGELIAVVGASGAGKSTLLHILGLLDRPTSGRVCFEGQDLFQLPEAAQAYIRRIEELAGTPVTLVSVGPSRDQTVRREPIRVGA